MIRFIFMMVWLAVMISFYSFGSELYHIYLLFKEQMNAWQDYSILWSVHMKKLLKVISMVIIVLSLSACSDNDNVSTNYTSNTSVTHENLRVDYTDQEVIEIIREHSDFKISDDIITEIPKSIDHISKFFCGTTPALDNKSAIENFHLAFEYLFPQHEFDDSVFYYQGGLTAELPLGKGPVSDYYDKIESGEETVSLLIYREDETDKEDRVALVCQSPFGNTLTTVNKNVMEKIAYQMNLTDTYGVEISYPERYFTCIGRFAPNSEDVFPLLDGEISIKDAVSFYKNYIADLPCTIESDFSVNVNDVYVYKISDELYYFYYSTSKNYDEIPFDYALNGTHGGRDNRDLGIGGMIKCCDVDFIYGTFKLETVIDEEQFSEYLSFERAVEIVSEQMTSYVDFEVTAAQLVYCAEKDLGTGKLGETRMPVFPAWKITLYNPNDDFSYCCYVNALDGEFESFKEWQ